VPYVQQLGSESQGTEFVLASVPGRPYNVGFTFRIISATASDSQLVATVTEYTFNSATCGYETSTDRRPAVPFILYRGHHREFTAGRGTDKFTVVYIKCADRCQVSIIAA